jgi:hypothetical protein
MAQGYALAAISNAADLDSCKSSPTNAPTSAFSLEKSPASAKSSGFDQLNLGYQQWMWPGAIGLGLCKLILT